MSSSSLVLGIDGGGTKTLAWLANETEVVGHGLSGPSNPQAVGFPNMFANLEQAITLAFEEANIANKPVAVAVLALAGSDRDENRQALERWANQHKVANSFRIVHDALPVLMAGSPDGWGVALIAGTGSLAFGQTRDGRSARAGGWGYLLGDEGSGYAIARAGLRAASKMADGRAPDTLLLAAFLERLQLEDPKHLIPAVYRIAADRAAIAALASVVTKTANKGDTTALRLIEEAASGLADLVASAAAKLNLSDETVPLALAGGVLLGDENLRTRMQAKLEVGGLRVDPINTVEKPVAGAIRIARGVAKSL